MVSNVLGIDQDELVAVLKTFKTRYADDAEYAKARADLPKTWPL